MKLKFRLVNQIMASYCYYYPWQSCKSRNT